MKKDKLTGIILAGGKSQRMGKDKGMCYLHGKPMVSYAIHLLEMVCDELIICANSDEYTTFGYPVFHDEIKNIGPIGGVYTGLLHTSTEHNLIVSCDTPLLNKEIFNLILFNREGFQVVVPVIESFFEPLTAYYHSSVLPFVKQQIDAHNFKLQGIFKQLNFLPLSDQDYPEVIRKDKFINVNTQEILIKLENQLQL